MVLTTLCFSLNTLGQTTVTVEPGKDNTLYENPNGSLSNGQGDYLFAGKTNAGATRRAVIQFDLAFVIPQGSVITSASLVMVMDQTISGNQTVSLHAATADWGEGPSLANGNGGGGTASLTSDATWIHRFFPSTNWTTPGGDFASTASASTPVGGNGTYTWTSAQLAADVQNWVNNVNANFGWVVIGNESANGTAKAFFSGEAAMAANRPKLQVTYTPPCAQPDVPVVTLSDDAICAGESIQLTATGDLFDASAWFLYAGSCGGTPLASNASGVFNLTPSAGTTYFVRGEGGCVTPGACGSDSVTVFPLQNAAFSYPDTSICQAAATISPTLTGTPGGQFSSLPPTAALNTATGQINLSQISAVTYTIRYVTPGPQCADTADVRLKILPATAGTDSITLCIGESFVFGNQTITASGTYTGLFPAANGCDSVVTLRVGVITPDTAIQVLPGLFVSEATNATFQWLDCTNGGVPVPGATDSTFRPGDQGFYALAVTQNGCTDTSACQLFVPVSIDRNVLTSRLEIFPNPASNQLFIRAIQPLGAIEARVFNLTGQLVAQWSGNLDVTQSLSVGHLPVGMYVLRVKTTDGAGVFRFEKK